MNAMRIQIALIKRYGERRGMPFEEAAFHWIRKYARMFRAYYNRHAK